MDPTWRETSDTALVVAVGRYDPSALAELYRRHGGPVHNLALRITNDRVLADDVTQEVFVLLWNSPTTYDADRGPVRSWLLMKSHSRSVDLVRAEAARRRRDEDRINDPAQRADELERYDLDREVWDLAVADRVQVALRELDQEERKAITLAYFGGHSYRSVAEMLGQPEGTVKSRIRNGLRTMGRRLRDLDENMSAAEILGGER